MQWKYVLSEPDLGDAEVQAATDCIRSGWLSTGPRVKAFEEAFAEMHGVKHAVAVSSGTAALHLAYLALGIGRDHEVIQPSLSFVAAANMARAIGATPVFADVVSLVEPTVDPDHVRDLITPSTRAVVAMHFGGYPCRMGELVAICEKAGVPLIEDACHGPAQRVPAEGNRALGTFGKIGCFSFFSNKNMTCGEGGMVVTDDDDLAAAARALRSHGMTTLSWERHKGRAATYDVTAAGFNYRMDDLRAALGVVQLAKLDSANARRRDLACQYAEAFSALGRRDVSYVFGHAPATGTAHVGAVLVPEQHRDRVREALKDEGIQTSLHYPPIHLFSSFASDVQPHLPHTEMFARRVISLPLYPGLPDAAVADVVDAIHRALDLSGGSA